MLGTVASQPSRYVIDFDSHEINEASAYKPLFARVKKLVLPDRQKAVAEEEARNKEARDADPGVHVNVHHANFLDNWWHLSYNRSKLIEAISKLPRYIVCGRVTKRPIFEFIHPAIRPNDALTVFALDDDYSFGILQSQIHWRWFHERCSTLKADFRYTSNTVYDTFPWPQDLSFEQAKEVAEAARQLRRERRAAMQNNGMNLRDLYRLADLPGKNPLKHAQSRLDATVRAAYAMGTADDFLQVLLTLNLDLAKREKSGKPVHKPGLPKRFRNREDFLSSDCVTLI